MIRGELRDYMDGGKHRPFAADKPRYRPARIGSRIREELLCLIPGSLSDPRLADAGTVLITQVEVAPDLKNALVRFSLLDPKENAEKVEAALNQAAGFLRQELKYSLDSKVTPHLMFRYDHGYDNSVRVEQLLAEVSKKKTNGT